MTSMNWAFFCWFALPLVAAQYYNLDRSLLSMITGLMSLYALGVLVNRVIASCNTRFARAACSYGVTFVLACYFYGQFLSYYLQGSYFNQQFYYHMNLSSVTETWLVYWPLMALFAAWLISFWICLAYLGHRVPFQKSTRASMMILVVLSLVLDPGLRQSAIVALTAKGGNLVQSLSEIDWQLLKLDRKALDNDGLIAEPGKNLVLIYMEGLDVIYTEEDIFPGLTPNLNRLNSQGAQLENYIPIEGTGWTMAGIVSSLCGTPLVHNLGLDGNVIMFSGFLDRAVCLPDILNIANYQQVFMGGASLSFAGKDEFLNAHSFDRVLGRDELIPRLADPSYLGGWGLFDDSLFDLALEEFNVLAQSEKPFNLTILTVDTHHPTGEPSASCDHYPHSDNSILQAVHCTDQLIGRFIENLHHHPAYEDTVIVLTSDHLGMRNNAFPLFPQDYNRKLYFNVLNAGPHFPRDRLATPVDLAPTILGLLDVEHSASFLAGGNLLEREVLNLSDAENFANRQKAIEFINTRYLSSLGGEGELIYSLSETKFSDLEFSEQVADATLTSMGLSFDSTGTDPYFILPEVSFASREPLHMYVTFQSDRNSTFTLYYQTEGTPYFSEANTIKANTTAGENRLRLSLSDVPSLGGKLRIDPGAVPGAFVISHLEIRSE